MITKPMLAETAQLLEDIDFSKGILCSPKLDGIRCLCLNGKALSRKFKSIPNCTIREYIETVCFDVTLDGELTSGKTFQACSSEIMSQKGNPDFYYNVFDTVGIDLKEPFISRYERLKNIVESLNKRGFTRIRLVPHTVINNISELLAYETKCLSEGYEGVMIRSPNGPYKEGRSTVKEGWLLKLKRFEDFEAQIIGFEEKLHNNNEATVDNLGHTKRSSHQENLVPAGTLGALVLRKLGSDVVFNCGTGFDDKLRQEIWDNRETMWGKTVKIQSQKCGELDKPRFPSFLGFRHEGDM